MKNKKLGLCFVIATYVFLLVTFLITAILGLKKPTESSNSDYLWKLNLNTTDGTYSAALEGSAIAAIVFLVLFAVSLVGTIFVARKQVKLLYVIIVFAVVLLFVIIALVGSKPYTDFMTREDQKYDMFLKMETDPTVGLKFSYTGFGSFMIAFAVIAGLGYAGLGALQAKSLFANK